MRNLKTVFVIAAVAAASVSCGDVVRQGKSPVFLIIDSMLASAGGTDPKFALPLLSDVMTKGSIFNDLGQATIRAVPKDITNPVAPTSNEAVTLTRYRVVFTRSDGHNVPGVDVPLAFDGAVTASIFPNSSSTAVVFDLVRHTAKLEAPLADLRQNLKILYTLANVTFYGRDQVGNEISVTGTIQVDFADFADPS